MLRNFRQVFKGSQTPMTVVMGIVLLGLVAYLAPSQGNPEAPDNVMARVYGRDVLKRDVDQAMSDMVRRMGKQANLEMMLPFMQSQALRQLINQKLTEELAARHGIVVTDAEVRAGLEARLRQYPVFLTPDKQLRDTNEINGILKESGLSLNIWEREVRLSQAVEKLRAQAGNLVPVDEAWVAREHRVRNEKITFEAVTVNPDVAAVADPGDAKLGAFLSAAGSRFQMAPRRVIQYVTVDQASMGDALKVDDAAVKTAYESKKAQYTELKASHILFSAKTDAEFAEAMKKAEELRPKLVAGLDFAKTAEEQSQDPSAKANKGDLGWFKHGSMVKPFEDAALALKPNEISRPVKTSFGVHLIRLEGRKDRAFDEVKEEIRGQLTQERFASKGKDKLEQMRKRTGDRGDLAAAARNLNLKVAQSKPFLDEPGVVFEGLSDAGMVPGEAFRLKVGQVSKVLRCGNAFVLFRVQEERPVAVPPLNEIRDKVLAAYRAEEARRAALEQAKTKLAGDNLAALGTVETKENATLSSLGELGQHGAIRNALLDTLEGKTTPLLWTPEGKLWVAKIKARTAAEALNFDKRRTLVQEIQSTESVKLLTAELQDLDAKGRLRPGFSSLWGRMGGIWINEAANRRAKADMPDIE